MKSLVTFYSRTGNTRKVAEEIAMKSKSDIEEIFDKKDRKGFLNYLIAAKDSALKKFTQIEGIKRDPSQYDLVIIGTPIWACGITPAIRTYLNKNKFNKVAFFCTEGGSGEKRAFEQMEKISKKPIAVLSLIEKEIKNKQYGEKIKGFCDNLKHVEMEPDLYN